MKILIGYDGSQSADAAIDDLARAGIPAKSQVMVVSAVDVWPQLPASSFKELDKEAMVNRPVAVQRAHKLAAQAREEAGQLAAAGAQRVNGILGDATVAAEVRLEAPATAILTKAQEWQADLIVMGSQGRGALGRAMLGSVSQTVLSHAPCSVRVGRHRATPARPALRLIVGVDGSNNSASAVAAIAMRPWPAETDVLVLVALDVRLALATPAIEDRKTVQSGGEEWIRAMADGAANELRRSGLSVEVAVRHGDPKNVLLEEASAVDTDCIFLGARGQSRVQRLLLGSVSAAVSARAACSVEVIRGGGI